MNWQSTRDGRRVVFLERNDADLIEPNIVAVRDNDGTWFIDRYQDNGRYRLGDRESVSDINVTPHIVIQEIPGTHFDQVAFALIVGVVVNVGAVVAFVG